MFKGLNKENLHHAYLIEGVREEILPEVLQVLAKIDLPISGPDFFQVLIDNFKIKEAKMLRKLSLEKGVGEKRIFLLAANTFSSDAQNSLLKMFEEPIANTHFFVLVPSKDSLLPTLVSRFYLIQTEKLLTTKIKQAETFLSFSLPEKINFIKNFLAEATDKMEANEEAEEFSTDSARSEAMLFLNALETVLHQKLMSRMPLGSEIFEQIFKTREYLRMPGSATKTLLESVALALPKL